MKKTIKGLLVMSAVVSSFFMAQVVAAETVVVEGTVKSITPCVSGDCGEVVLEVCEVTSGNGQGNGQTSLDCTEVATVYGLKTLDYWDSEGVCFPVAGEVVDGNGVNDSYVEGDELVIQAESHPCGRLVAISMEITYSELNGCAEDAGIDQDEIVLRE